LFDTYTILVRALLARASVLLLFIFFFLLNHLYYLSLRQVEQTGKRGLKSIGYGIAIGIFRYGVSMDYVRWGYSDPKKPKNVENFIGQHEKVSRAAKSRANKGKRKHCCSSGIIALQDSFY
jgi:hypothetical protein